MMEEHGMPAPKRVGPPKVEPVRVDGLTIEALHWGKERGLGQNGGYIAARDAATGEERWILQVYRIDYDPELESDVQDIFIEKLARSDGATVVVVDERKRRFTVDVTSRTVQPG